MATTGLLLVLLALAAVFAWLGTWQLERRAWKLDLIARVERRLAAAPDLAPGPTAWPGLTREDEYRRVRLAGRFLPGRDTLVSASTKLGPGYWLLTPLRDEQNFTVLVNRGFVASRRPWPPPRDPVVIDGLLRVTEPNGDLLRTNDLAADLWYSRDVAAIARQRRLGRAAPYFVDEAAVPGAPPYPRAGLTVVAFRNAHLAYALTWYAMAALMLFATSAVFRRGCAED